MVLWLDYENNFGVSMSFFYKPPKNKRSYLSFFIFVYILSFILYFIGHFINDFIIVIFIMPTFNQAFDFIVNKELTSSSYWIQFMFPIALSIPIGLLAGLITYFLKLANFGAKFMTKIYIRIASGRVGRIIGLIPLFGFGGEWVVETKAKEEIDLSTGRGMFKELVAERGGDVLVFSSLLGSFLLVVLHKLAFVDLSPTTFYFPYKNVYLINGADLFAIFTAFITIFVLCFYIPSMWIFKDAEVKKIVFDKNDSDIKDVTNVAITYRQGLGTFIGFSGLIGIGSIAIDWASKIPGGNVTITSSTILTYIAIYSYALAFFLEIAAFILPGICLTMIRYMRKHEEFILSTRQSLIKTGTGKSGSIQFAETSILAEIESTLALIKKEVMVPDKET